MTHFNSLRTLSAILIMSAVFTSCKNGAKKESPLIVREDPEKAAAKANEIRKSTPAQLADGLTLTLWASDSLAPDPIAMSIDDDGNVYLTRTNRQKNSEFDIRGYRHWMIPSISWESVEDRRAFLHSFFAPEKSKENEWLQDLNKDGSHDWRDLAVEKDEIWKLEDRLGDGMADISTRILNDFHDEVTDVAEGLLVRKNDMFLAIAPDLWRLKDSDGDGVIDEKAMLCILVFLAMDYPASRKDQTAKFIGALVISAPILKVPMAQFTNIQTKELLCVPIPMEVTSKCLLQA
jgi:quinoprotein glucose dehydrogenase